MLFDEPRPSISARAMGLQVADAVLELLAPVGEGAIQRHVLQSGEGIRSTVFGVSEIDQARRYFAERSVELVPVLDRAYSPCLSNATVAYCSSFRSGSVPSTVADQFRTGGMFDYDARPVTPQLVVVGSRSSAGAYAISDFLTRNGRPYEWVDAGDFPESVESSRLPLCIGPDGTRLEAATIEQIAAGLGMVSGPPLSEYDLAIHWNRVAFGRSLPDREQKRETLSPNSCPAA